MPSTAAPPQPSHLAPGAVARGPGDHAPLRAELFGIEHLEAHAESLAAAPLAPPHSPGPDLPGRLRQIGAELERAYHRITRAARQQTALGSDAEWLVDNYHIVEDNLREVRQDLPGGYFKKLPKLAGGPYAGLPRVYVLGLELIAHTDSALDEATITRVVEAYQRVAPLTIGELWAVPIMLRLGLLENLARLARHMLTAWDHRCEAEEWKCHFLACAGRELAEIGTYLLQPSRWPRADWSDPFVVRLMQVLRDHGPEMHHGIAWLEDHLRSRNSDVMDIVRREHQRQAANQVSVGNCVTSLRLLSALDWMAFFERTSTVEAELRRDPAGVYTRQDFATRDRYRRRVEELTEGSRRPELEVARRAVALAEAAADSAVEHHVGTWLIGPRKADLERELQYRPRWGCWLLDLVVRHGSLAYFTALAVTTALLAGGTVSYGGNALELEGGLTWSLLALVAVAVLLPASELAVGVVNHLITLLVPPRVLPKMDFKAGIPAECAAFVVVPSLLNRADSAANLLERLEIHYLCNPDPSLSFALLTDFADADAATRPDDEAWLTAALAGVRALNAKYAPHGPDRFFLFHRRRQWNPVMQVWMGWERKRGKLSEFNRLLRGARDTSFTTMSCEPAEVPHVRFVVTLDTDTKLPRDTARRLVATLAHPLNRPQFDPAQGRVVEGYAVLQPRVSLTLASASKTWFARIFAGSAGIDPYTTAVSDVYMDLFGRGSFTGKGIYDVDAFEAAAGHLFPDNHILSHDLIEGNYARCGLATDIEVLDDFPTLYTAFAGREHRWIRGDWQILQWLFGRVPAPEGRRRNPLPALERWKVFDNLRRSLVPPALVLLLVLGWTVLPGSPWFWTAAALSVPLLPLLQMLLNTMVSLLRGPSWSLPWLALRASVGATAAQAGLSIVLLANQALLTADAVVRTLVRLFITRKHLLEWETSASTERRLGTGVWDFMRMMWPAAALAVACAALVALVNPAALLPAAPLLLAWLVSPFVACRLSRPLPQLQDALTPQDRLAVRRLARKTWLFFETYVSAEDHWLPPDNYQEDPKGVVAHRTSPTNMGLYLLSSLAAHDLGYVSLPTLLDRLENTLDTFGQLAMYHGHFFNWYDTQSLQPLPPEYVSTVDSGNLLGCLLVLEQGLREKAAQPWSRQVVHDGLADTLRLLTEAVAALEPPPGRDHDGPHPLQQTKVKLQALLDQPPGDLGADRLWLEKLHQEARDLTAEESHLAALLHESPEELRRWALRFAELVAARRAELAACQSGNGGARIPLSWAERCRHIADCAAELAGGMNFRFLYNDKRELLSIGWNHAAGQLDKAHYDLLASEACLTSFLAVSRGEAPRQHWFHLGRPLTRVAGGVTLVSWSGSMFEYLMPRLLLKPYAGTLLAESWRTAVDRHIEYGKQQRVPWGISESGFSALDSRLDYQYQSFGVPGLGLKRGLGKDLVIAPYATALALAERPHAAADNFRHLAEAGAEGPFGFYEALDYARDRSRRQQPDLVRSYMAHHQGMALVAMTNCLLGDVMPWRLRAWPAARANEVLLQERVPALVPLVTPHSDEAAPPTVREVPSLVSRHMTTAHTPHPRTHLLSNGRYSVMLTNAGAGWSAWKDLAVLRWREDRTRDRGGQFLYVRDQRSGKFWSAGHHPTGRRADSYEVIFSTDKAEYHRRDGDVATHWEITVSPDNDAEVRRVSFTNHGELPCELEITSYGEVVLAPHRADLAHPAFGKLFLETEYLPGQHALLCRRRPRSADQKPLWAVHILAVDGAAVDDIQWETDRARFLGRGRTATAPAACDNGARLSGTTGPVLDPVLSLRCRVWVPADGAVSLAFTTAVAETREQAVAIADEYHDFHSVTRAFELAWAHSQVELRHSKMSTADAHLYQRLAGHVLFAGPALRDAGAVTANRLGTPSLWALGISGDLPIVLLRIDASDQLPLARQLLQAHAYWRLKGLVVDVVLLNEHPPSYQAELHQQLQELVRGSDSHALADKPGGVFVREAPQIPEHIRTALLAAARVVLSGSAGSLAAQVDRQDEAPELPAPLRPLARSERRKVAALPRPRLQFDNGIGGFTGDGREYVLQLSGGVAGLPPAPWCNVIANPAFGFLVSESGGGFTWAGNSQMNRLTGWNNDPVADPPSEVIYLRDDRTGEFWTPTPLPRGNGPATVRHGQGYTIFEQRGDGLEQELLLLVPPADPIKLLRLKVRNTGKQPRRLTAVFYAEWVLGTLRAQAALQVICVADEATGALLARNYWNADFASQIAFAATTDRPVTITADRGEFLGRNGTLAAPAALGRVKLSGRVEPLADPCAALMTPLEVPPGAEREVVFFLGQAGSVEEVQRLLQHYRGPGRVEQALADVRRMWDDILGAVQVHTPDAAFDLMLNRWLLYQVLSCRVWGRSALYQSGGAYGFRDQLQDVMALVHGAPQEARAQILRAAAHQFKEGDVQHWWHPPVGRGVRTRFSDDLLWLPLVACHYVTATGDAGVLDEQVPFLQAPLLPPEREEDYGLPTVTQETASVYDHCVRALEHGFRTGEHGLPLMETGDWNDGMNRVGAEGQGESVWVAWFLVVILRDFAEIAERRGDTGRAAWCRERGEQLRAAVEKHAWDGDWYLRAYFDDGTPLGSHANDECRIDSIVQSWAVLAGVADQQRCTKAMAALEQQLVRDKDRLILLFAPPFDQGKLQPGYIKGYLPGIRENGGQYTHAAAWVVLATALLGRGTRAKELFDLLSPVPSAATPDAVARYKVEPYVVAADVYSLPPHVGRGGWTWYTGSAGWLHRVGLEYLLGCRRRGGRLHIEPCIPASWPGFEAEWRHGTAIYHVSVKNPRGVERGVTLVSVDGQRSEDGTIPLADDGRRHEVVVEMG